MLRRTIYELKSKDTFPSTIVLDPYKARQICENRLDLINFTAKWEKGEPLVNTCHFFIFYYRCKICKNNNICFIII